MTSQTVERQLNRHNAKLFIALAALASLSACAGSPSALLTADNPADLLTTASTSAEHADARKSATTKGDNKPISAAKSGMADLQRQHTEAPTQAAPALAYAHALKSTGQIKEARQVLSTAHAGPNSTNELAGTLGLIELELGQTQKAQKLLQHATATGSSDWRYMSGLGVAYSMQGKQSEAQKHFKKALAAAPGNKSILNNLAMSLMLDRKIDQAEELLKQAKTGESAPAAATQNLILASRLREHGSAVTEPAN